MTGIEPASPRRGVMAFALACVLIAAIAALARAIALWSGTALMGFEKSPVSGTLVAILLGLAVANLAPAGADRAVPALQFCLTSVLRTGIVLLGLRLSLVTAAAIGLHALPVIAACIVTAIAAVHLAGRAFGLSRALAALIAVGTSICGVTAIAAMAPLIRARAVEVSYATACISLFGLAALFVHPPIAAALFGGSPHLAGMFLGTAIHDTAQVAGAALMYEEQFSEVGVLESATVTKLVRNLCMLVVIPAIAFLQRARAGAEGGASHSRAGFVPLFVLGFVACSSLRTIGDLGDRPFGVLSRDSWGTLLALAGTISEWALIVAMAAVGLATRFSAFRALGWRPLVLGFSAAAVVALVSGVTIRSSFS